MFNKIQFIFKVGGRVVSRNPMMPMIPTSYPQPYFNNQFYGQNQMPPPYYPPAAVQNNNKLPPPPPPNNQDVPRW